MPGSTALKPGEQVRVVFVPRAMGVLVLLVIMLAFGAGALRQEPALLLTGAVFLVLWAYSLFMTLLLALVHSRRARRILLGVNPREVAVGETAQAVYSGSRMAQLPGIVIRCRLCLAAKDGRRINYDFNPADPATYTFAAKERGAFFSSHDELAISDILGFFRFAFRLPVVSAADASTVPGSPRLLVYPRAAEEAPPVSARAGDSKLKPEFSLQRTDNMIDHRPYVPGDDPRRINWKLYGHGGGLFVRDGEREPPPQSHIIILIDTEYDPLLYNQAEARQGIDILCENALAAALACTESGMEVLTGWSGGIIREVRNPEPAVAFAWPAATPLSAAAALPAVPGNCGILILALPRASAEHTALDRFLQDTRGKTQTAEVLFLTHGPFFAEAELCAALYNRRPGIKAQAVGV